MKIKFHFYRGQRIFSKIIQWRTFSEFSHCSVEIDGYIYEAIEGTWVRRIKALKTAPKSLIYTIEKVITPEQHKNAKKWVKSQLSKPYDYIGLLAFLWVPKRRKTDEKYWCSEFICVLCEYIGMLEEQIFPVSPWTMFLLLK